MDPDGRTSALEASLPALVQRLGACRDYMMIYDVCVYVRIYVLIY